MATAYNRRKQPELIRRLLLDCAATLALEQGLANVSVQAVSAAAGVTKGGLFHHFPSKQALVEGVAADLIERIDASLATAAKGKATAEFQAKGFVELLADVARFPLERLHRA